MTKVGSSCCLLADFTRSGCTWAPLSTSRGGRGVGQSAAPRRCDCPVSRDAGRCSLLVGAGHPGCFQGAARPWVPMWDAGSRLVKGVGSVFSTEVFGIRCLIFRQIWGISKEKSTPELWFYLPSSFCLSLSFIFAVRVCIRVIVHMCPPVCQTWP